MSGAPAPPSGRPSGDSPDIAPAGSGRDDPATSSDGVPRGTARRSLAWSLSQRVTEVAIVLVSVALLARLLPPDAFGLFATAYAPVLLLEGFCRTGATAAIVRLDRLDDGRASAAALFASVSAVAGVALLAAGVIGSARVPAFAGGELPALLALLGGRLLLVPARTVAEAILMRALAFDALCLIGIAAVLANAVTALSLAARGLGAEALAFGVLAEALVFAAAATFAARASLPAIWRAPRESRTIARACREVSLGGALAEVGHVAATTVSSAVLGVAATGFYDRARRVVGGFDDLLMNAIRPIVLPVLSARARRGEPPREAYLFKTAAISGIAWPFFGSLALLAEPVVRVLLGEGWLETVPVVRAFCLLGVAAPFHLVDGQFLISLGREREYLRIQVRSQLAGIALLLVAAPFGIAWLAAAIVGGKAVKAVLTTRALTRALGTGPRALLAAVARSAAMALSTCAAVAAVLAFRGGDGVDLRLVASVAIAAAVAYALPTVALRHPLWIEARVALPRRARPGGGVRP